MKRVLVTGGTGMLGRVLVPKLQEAGYIVRVMSRKTRPAALAPALEWAQADVLTGEGLEASVRDVDLVIHGATSPSHEMDRVEVEGTHNVLERVRAANIRDFIYVSIVGIDRTPYPYYRAKVEAEKVVTTFGMPYTILRATQFYELLDIYMGNYARFPIVVIDPNMKFQPVDVREVSDKLVEQAGRAPQGRLPDMAGPEVLTLEKIMGAWLDAKQLQRAVLKIPIPGKFAAATRQGLNTNPQQRCGKITWTDWLAENYGRNKNGRQK